MEVNCCGTIWTIGAMAAGAVLNAGYTFMIRNAYGQTASVSGASLSPA